MITPFVTATPVWTVCPIVSNNPGGLSASDRISVGRSDMGGGPGATRLSPVVSVSDPDVPEYDRDVSVSLSGGG